MKNLFLTVLLLALGLVPSLEAFAEEPYAPHGDPEHSGVAGGGAGGLPSAKVGIASFGPTVLTALPYKPNLSAFRRSAVSSAIKPSEVLLSRRQMLDAIDTALNANDLTIKVDEEIATVRILSMDLKRATLRGRILETNKPVFLIEKGKQTSGK
jgi:hypothetical protein